LFTVERSADVRHARVLAEVVPAVDRVVSTMQQSQSVDGGVQPATKFSTSDAGSVTVTLEWVGASIESLETGKTGQ